MPATADPRWKARPLSLEELIIAYLRSDTDAANGSSHGAAAAPYGTRRAPWETEGETKGQAEGEARG
jgi:hypothetical protein